MPIHGSRDNTVTDHFDVWSFQLAAQVSGLIIIHQAPLDIRGLLHGRACSLFNVINVVLMAVSVRTVVTLLT